MEQSTPAMMELDHWAHDRAQGWVQSKEEIKGSLKVAAPLPIGRQSDGGDGDWRQRTVVLVAGML
jgi:hypothetical protein